MQASGLLTYASARLAKPNERDLIALMGRLIARDNESVSFMRADWPQQLHRLADDGSFYTHKQQRHR